jgi:signal transduction histidine kinase
LAQEADAPYVTARQPPRWRALMRPSIGAKLIALIAIVVAAIVAALTVYFPSQEIGALREEQVGRARTYGALLARQVRSAVAFEDRETAREVLASLDADPDVVAVTLFVERGTTLYAHGRPGGGVARARDGVTAPRTVTVADRIAVVAPVESPEGPRGVLVIELSMDRLRAEQRVVTVTAVAVGLGALLVGVLAAWWIARSLTRRLRAMARVAGAVAAGDAGVEAIDDRSPDEIGTLARAFEHMLGQLGDERQRLHATVAELTRAEDALAQSNRDLEARVAARTAELTEANHQLADEMAQRGRVEVELRQAQKLESVGRLAAGVAHELNTPIQYVGDSCVFLQEATTAFMAMIEEDRQVVAEVAAGRASPAEAVERVRDLDERHDLVYLREQVPLAAQRSLDGVERVASIVRTLKEFASPDRRDKVQADLNQAIERTLIIARSEYKYVAEVRTELGDIPLVACHLGELNQVVLHIVVNAAHAIEARVRGTAQRGEIVITTRAAGGWVEIAIRDDGCGIAPALIDKIFDPFFTTKEIGKGTGQGLAIARSVIVDKHGGRLTVTSELGRGTTFTIGLPLTAETRAA